MSASALGPNLISLQTKPAELVGLSGNLLEHAERSCEECNFEKAHFHCESCGQHLCRSCNISIHNKGKRASHCTQELSTILEALKIEDLFLVSLNSLRNDVEVPLSSPDFGARLIEFISTQYEDKKLERHHSLIYVYYNSQDMSSEDELTTLHTHLKQFKNYALVDIQKLQTLKEVQDTKINESQRYSTDEATILLAKSLITLSRGRFVRRVFIYDNECSFELCTILVVDLLPYGNETAEKTPQFFFVSHREGELQDKQLQFKELTDKEYMQFMNGTKPRERLNSSNETAEPKESTPNMSEGFTDEAGEERIHPEHEHDHDQDDSSYSNAEVHTESTRKTNEDNSATHFILNAPCIGLPEKAGATGDIFASNYYTNQSFEQAFNQHQHPIKNTPFDLEKHTDLPHLKLFEREDSPNSDQTTPTNIHSHNQNTMNVSPSPGSNLIRQNLKDQEVDGSLKLSHFLQAELRKLAVEGELIILKEHLIPLISDTITKEFNKKPEHVLEKADQAGIIHITVRKFADNQPFTYIGLKLDTITIESLGWVAKSIKRDEMAPTEKLILSRIKECFALKLDPNVWKLLLDMLLSAPNAAGKELTNKDNAVLIHPLRVTRMNDPSTGAETHAIYIRGEEWPSADLGEVDYSLESWKVFLKFLNDFFREEEEAQPRSQPDTYQHHHHQHHHHHNSQYQHHQHRYTGHYNKYEKQVLIPKEGKAIPGGRYGCAQFIKACGAETLRKESLGKLNLYVQEAINLGILRYQRTLLVKNAQGPMISPDLQDVGISVIPQDTFSEKKRTQLKRIKDALIEILAENPKGLSLAQIPQYLRRKLSFSFNLQELGFPKLKNLLTTMTDDIKIELSGTNHSFASLKNPEKYSHLPRRHTRAHNQQFYHSEGAHAQQELFGYSISNPSQQNTYQEKLRLEELDNNIGAKQYIKKFNTVTPSTQGMRVGKMMNRKNVSNFDDYLNKVRHYVQEILVKSNSGLDIDQLHRCLSYKLGTNFDFRWFSSHSFSEFLIQYADDIADIEVRKSPFGIQTASYIIHPKHTHFGPPGIMHNYQQQPMSQPQPTHPPMMQQMGSYYPSNTSQYSYGNPHLADIQKQQPLVSLPHNPVGQTKQYSNFSPFALYTSQERQSDLFQRQDDKPSMQNKGLSVLDQSLSSISNTNLNITTNPGSRLSETNEDSHINKLVDDLLDENDDIGHPSFLEKEEYGNLNTNWGSFSTTRRQQLSDKDQNKTASVGLRQDPSSKCFDTENKDYSGQEENKRRFEHVM